MPSFFLYIIFSVFFLAPSLFSNNRVDFRVSRGETEFDRIFFEDPENKYFVEDILMDHQGYIWFAAKEGLYRYDGQKSILKGTDFYGSNIFASETILSILHQDEYIWIATAKQLWRMNLSTFRMESFSIPLFNEPLSGNIYRGVIYADANGKIYSGYWNGGFLVFDPSTGEMTHFFSHSETDSIPFSRNTITDIKSLNDSILWIATHDGLFTFNKTDHSFDPFWINDSGQAGNNQINSIFQASSNTLWMGTNNGLVKMNIPDKEITRFNFDDVTVADHERNIVESIAETPDGMLWIGTRYGLYSLHPVSEKIQAFYHDKHNPNSIHGNYVRKVYVDITGNIWIGHHSGAVSYLSGRKKDFTAYTFDSDYVADQRVHSVFSEPDKLLFGTETGLYIYYKNTGKLENYRHDPLNKHSLSHNFVSGITKDIDSFYWISTDKGGVNRFDLKTGRFENVISGSRFIASNSYTDVWSIYLDNTGYLWCGLGGDGLLGYHTRTGEIKKYRHEPGNSNSLAGNFVGPVVRSNDGTLWVGIVGVGINYFVPGQDTFKKLSYAPESENSLSGTNISSLCLTNDNKLFIGSEAGIDILDIGTGKITPFLFNNHIPGNVVRSVVMDKSGDFWIASRNGLMKYEPRQNDFQLFFKTDGISSNNFLPGSVHQGHNGEIAMGTQNGFISFFPWEIRKNPRIPPIVITDIKLMNQSLVFYPRHEGNFNYKNLRIPHHQNNISFYFSSLDFNNPAKNQLKYKLEGFDTEWTSSVSGFVNYTNLPPGIYTFRVIGSNNDNVWNMQGASHSFIVTPPWWATIWFRLIIFLVIVGSIFAFIYFRVNKINSQKKQLESLVAQRTAELNEQKENTENKNKFLEQQKSAIEHQALLLTKTNLKLEEQKVAIEKQARELKEIDRLKSGFFASISHEFRTPLTLIINALSLLKENKDDPGLEHPQTQHKLSIIKKNANRLHRLIEQLLDMVKIEAGFMKLSVSEGNIEEFTSSITSLFSVKAEAEKINMKTSVDLKSPIGYLDWDKLEKILYNLLSNAIKFTKSNGTVSLDLSSYTDAQNRLMLKMSVQDNGCGIPEELQDKVFTMFFQSDQARRENRASTGLGLALAKQLALVHKGNITFKSEPSVGSSFTLVLPISRDSFSEEEINVGVIDPVKQLKEELKSYSSHITNNEVEDSHNKPRVLFVDDNKELCYLIREQLKADFNVEVAFDGVQGVEKSISQYPDIIVSDLMMPGISGINFCQRVKDDIRTEHLPFILLTARIDEKTEIEALKSQADDYITKPYSIEVLRLKLHNQLDTRSKLEAKFKSELNSPLIQKTNSYSNRFMKEAVEAITSHMDDPEFTVDELARELNMSRTQLYRKSEKLLGMSANNFIKKIKLNYSWELINDGEYNVSEVAYKIGFKTPGYFSKCFEEQFGVLPSKLLADLKDGIIQEDKQT